MTKFLETQMSQGKDLVLCEMIRFQTDRGLDKKEYDIDNEMQLVMEELLEAKGVKDKKDKEYSKSMVKALNVLAESVKLYEPDFYVEPNEHDEIDAFGAQHEQTDDEGGERGECDRCGQHVPQAGRLVLRAQDRHRVGRDAEVGRMAEADQAGEAHQQVQAHREDRHHQDLAHDLDVERLARQRHTGDDRDRDQLEDERSLCVHGLSLSSGCLQGATAGPPPSRHTPRCRTARGRAPCRRYRRNPRSAPRPARPTPSRCRQ